MEVWADTSALWALLNRRDQFHADARVMWRHISTLGWRINYCRIVHVELMQHLGREMAGRPGQVRKEKANAASAALRKLPLNLQDHSPTDFEQAEVLFLRYSDWPVGYVDVLIGVTAANRDAAAIWTFDNRDLAPFLRAQFSRLDVLLSPRDIIERQ